MFDARPIIVDTTELYPRHVEMHDEFGLSTQFPTDEQIFEAFLHEHDSLPKVVDYRYEWLKQATHTFYVETVELGLKDVIAGDSHE